MNTKSVSTSTSSFIFFFFLRLSLQKKTETKASYTMYLAQKFLLFNEMRQKNEFDGIAKENNNSDHFKKKVVGIKVINDLLCRDKTRGFVKKKWKARSCKAFGKYEKECLKVRLIVIPWRMTFESSIKGAFFPQFSHFLSFFHRKKANNFKDSLKKVFFFFLNSFIRLLEIILK